MDVFFSRPRAPLHPAPHPGPLRANPAGMAAMVYTTNIHVLAAGSKQGGSSGTNTWGNTNEKRKEHHNQLFSTFEASWTPLKPASGNESSPNFFEEPTESEYGRTDYWDYELGGAQRPVQQHYNKFDGMLANDEEHFGDLHSKEGRPYQELLGGEEREPRGVTKKLKTSHQGWQRTLEWVSSPVRKLLTPYSNWAMGIHEQPKTIDEVKILRKLPMSGPKKRSRLWRKHLPKAFKKVKTRRTHKKTPENDKKDMVKEFENGFYAATSRKPRESRRKTVKRVLGDETPGNPERGNFKVESFSKLAAILKSEKYKAVKPYIIEAKMMHLDGGGDWNLAWDRRFKLCMKAAGRDAGPPKKAVEVPKVSWAGTQDTKDTTEKKSGKPVKTRVAPQLAKASFAVATLWMLREIELSELKREDFSFDEMKKKVTLKLKKSKTDTEARGVCRVLQCTCTSACTWECPYEATWRFTSGGGKPTKTEWIDDGYIMVSNDGKKARKCDVVAAWKDLYGKEVTGHSPRRTGALQYIRSGWTISQVAFLGRWRSQVIYDYAREALETLPVNSTNSFNADSNIGKKGEDEPNDGTEHLKKEKEIWEREKMNELEAELEALKLDHEGMKKRLANEVEALETKARSRAGLLPSLVFSNRAQVLHLNTDTALCSPPFTWKTVCGWRFSGSNFTLQDGEPSQVNCQKCNNIAQSKGGERAMKGGGV